MLIIFENKLPEKKQTDEEFWDNEVQKAEKQLLEFDYGSGDYNAQLQSISELQIERDKAKARENRKEKKDIPWTAIAAVVGTIGTFVIGIVNAAVEVEKIQMTKRGQDIQIRGQNIQKELGELAYMNEQEFKTKNSTTWNQMKSINTNLQK